MPQTKEKEKKKKIKASHFLGHLALKIPEPHKSRGLPTSMKTQRDNAVFYIFNRSSLKSILTTIRTKRKKERKKNKTKKTQNKQKKKEKEKKKKEKNGGLFFSVKVFVCFFPGLFFFFCLLRLRHLSAWWLRWPRQWLLGFLV